MAGNNTEIEKRLWEAADELRANSKLKSSEYSTPVLGLIFLRYADHKFTIAKKELEGKRTGSRTIGKADYQARGVLSLPEKIDTILRKQYTITGAWNNPQVTKINQQEDIDNNG